VPITGFGDYFLHDARVNSWRPPLFLNTPWRQGTGGGVQPLPQTGGEYPPAPVFAVETTVVPLPGQFSPPLFTAMLRV